MPGCNQSTSEDEMDFVMIDITHLSPIPIGNQTSHLRGFGLHRRLGLANTFGFFRR
jgi:hypothetical protein